METYSKNGDILKKTITTEETYNLKALAVELTEIDKQITVLEKEPDEIMVANDSKFIEITGLNRRKAEIIKLLAVN